MEQGRQGGALAAGGDVLAAEIVNHGNSRQAGQEFPVADLVGNAFARIVPNSVAMEADKIDIRCRHVVLGQQEAHGRGVLDGQVADHRLKLSAAIGRGAQDGTQPRPKCGVVGHGGIGAEFEYALAVRANDGGVYPVERSAAH